MILLAYYTCREDLPALFRNLKKHPPNRSLFEVGIWGDIREGVVNTSTGERIPWMGSGEPEGYGNLPAKTLALCRYFASLPGRWTALVKCDTEFYIRSGYVEKVAAMARMTATGPPVVAGRIVRTYEGCTRYHVGKVEGMFNEEALPELIPSSWVQGGGYMLNLAAAKKVAGYNAWVARMHTYEDCMVSHIVGEDKLRHLPFTREDHDCRA